MKPMFTRTFLMLFLAVILGVSSTFANTIPAFAQTAGDSQNQPKGEFKISDSWSGYLQSAEQALDRKNLTPAQFETFRVNVEKIVANAQEQIELLTPEHEQLDQRLTELGPKPKDDEPPESENLSDLRAALGTDFAIIDGQLKDARQIIIRARQLKINALTKRRSKFVKSITTKSQNILRVDFWQKFGSGLYDLRIGFRLLIKDTFASMGSHLSNSPWKAFILVIGLLFGMLSYLFIKRKTAATFPRPSGDDDLTRKQAATWAAGKFIRFGLLNTAALIYIFALFSRLELMPGQFEKFAGEVVFSLSAFFIIKSLSNIFLDHKNSHSRIVNLSDAGAKSVQHTITIATAMIVILDWLNFSAVLLIFPFEMSVGLSVLLAVTGTIAISRILIVIERDNTDAPPPGLQEGGLLRWAYLKAIVWAGVVATLFALVLNYIALAEFIILQLVVGSAFLGILWLVLELIDTNRQSILTARGGSPSSTANMQSSKIKQISILGFGILKLLAILATVFAMSLPWGFRTNDWLQWIKGAFFGFQIGGLTVSFSAIFLAILLFLVGYTITRMLQSWLSNQFLPATNIEFGLRNSITTVFGYTGLTISAMMGIGAVGLDLSNLAIVAGALSVGVGFGLQSIVNNFVSGLILLAERPIKVGDWIVTGGGEGTVRKISVRSTEIQTFDRATIVVPNSTLITESITNWTHSSKLGRIKIAIGVGYDSDPDQIRDILLECMSEQEGVLKNPKPSVFFLDFGDNALLFEVRGFLSNIENGLGIRSNIRFSILRALRAANIEIPYPQRDIHIKTDASKAPALPEKQPTRRRRTPSQTKK